MPLPDQKVFFSPNENLSSQDANFVSDFLQQIHKTFSNLFVSNVSCRFNGFVLSFLNNSTPSPSASLTPGAVLFNLGAPLNVTDPNGYSGAIFAASPNAFAIVLPVSSTRTDSIDITYSELLGASGGIGATDPRDFIDGMGVITPNVPTNTRKISSYTFNYIQDSPSVNGGFPAAGAIRLCTFTVTTGGTCAQTFLLPNIWENQGWPTSNSVSPNNAEASANLNDSLSSLRFQLNAIIGKTNWYDSPVLSLLQLGNGPRFWGGTDLSGTPNTIDLTISNYPSNVSIINGTTLVFTMSNNNTGAVVVSTNGNATIPLHTSSDTDFVGGEFLAGESYEIFYNGTNYQVIGDVNPSVSYADDTIVKNGSFEYWAGLLPATWTSSGISGGTVFSQDHSAPSGSQGSIHGGSALKAFFPSGAAGLMESSLIPISPNNNYYVKFKTWATLNTLPVKIVVKFYDYQKNLVGLSSGYDFWKNIGGNSYPSVWTTQYGIVQSSDNNIPASSILAPPSLVTARYMQFSIGTTLNTVANATAWFDDIEVFYPGNQGKVIIYTTPGTYTFTTGPNCISLFIRAQSGGGSGAAGYGATQTASGGGSGAYAGFFSNVFPDTEYTLVVGAGGSGVNQGSGTDGNTGGFSSFNGVVVNGGGGGTQHSSGLSAGGSAGTAPNKDNTRMVESANGSSAPNANNPSPQNTSGATFSTPNYFNPPWTTGSPNGSAGLGAGFPTGNGGNGAAAIYY